MCFFLNAWGYLTTKQLFWQIKLEDLLFHYVALSEYRTKSSTTKGQITVQGNRRRQPWSHGKVKKSGGEWDSGGHNLPFSPWIVRLTYLTKSVPPTPRPPQIRRPWWSHGKVRRRLSQARTCRCVDFRLFLLANRKSTSLSLLLSPKATKLAWSFPFPTLIFLYWSNILRLPFVIFICRAILTEEYSVG